MDWSDEDREWVKNYLFNFKGVYTSEIITFNTIALKGAIRDVCRYYEKNNTSYDVNDICNNIENQEDEYRNRYPDLFKYVDLLNGCIVSVGTHPSGVLVSPIPVDENVGYCFISSCDNPVSYLDMIDLDTNGYVKLDVLGLDNVGITNKACQYANIERLTADNVDMEDMNVWRSIRDDTTAIFQMDGESGQKFISQMFTDDVINKIKSQISNVTMIELFALANASIRPCGDGCRQEIAKGEPLITNIPEVDNLLKSELGFCIYQEGIMRFIIDCCGYDLGFADKVRKGIAKKGGSDQYLPKIKEGFIKTMQEKYPNRYSQEQLEEIVKPQLKIIELGKNYGFAKGHSIPYSVIGFKGGYLRYYYPLEFLTACFNVWKDKMDKLSSVTEYAKKIGITIKSPTFRYSRAEYFFDKTTNSIFKGLESIKYLNHKMAEELYELRNNRYDNFTELLIDIIEKTSCNVKQLNILILLDYFSEFGHSSKLLEVAKFFDKRYSKKHIEKTKVKRIAEVLNFELTCDAQPFTPDEKVKVELKYLGYAETTIPTLPPDYCMVIDIITKYKNPVIALYRLCDGQVAQIKVKKNLYDKDKFEIYDMIKIIEIKEDFKWKKTENGFERSSEKEKLLALWNIVK